MLVQLGRVAAIARVAPTCRALRDAARAAEKAHRRVCYEGHESWVTCVAAAPDGRIITGSRDKTVKVWRGDELPPASSSTGSCCERPELLWDTVAIE